MPTFRLEIEVAGKEGRVAGIDEVGRGPWAGPVVAAACVLERKKLPKDLRDRIDDSKALTAKKRELVAAELIVRAKAGDGVIIGLAAASVAEIDRINILRATELAMKRALARLPFVPDHILVDGNRAPAFGCPVKAVVGGDHRSMSIAAASIVAKVARDRLMTRLAPFYPAFCWEKNAGYGTEIHADALSRLGPTVHHRRSFAPVAEAVTLFSTQIQTVTSTATS
jgi:ribonuclease HII